ncbi:MAG: hypothetical protein WCS70_06720 [Verrucomicrobiota bacterium]
MIRQVLPVFIFLIFSGLGSAQNINLGPLKGTLGVQAGLEYTDNLNNSETNRVTDFKWRFGPTFNGGLTIPIHIAGTGGEEMTISTGFAYSEEYSLNGNGSTRNFSSPVTADVYIPVAFGEWKLVVNESFTFENNNLDAAVAINESTQSFQQYNNNLSVGLTRNFGRASITFGGGRRDTIAPSEPSLEETVYNFSVTPAFLIRENYSIFWSTSYSLTYQADSQLQDSYGYSSSVGVNGQLTPYLNGTVSVGYSYAHLKTQVIGPGSGIFGGIFDPVTLRADNIEGVTTTIALSYAHPLNPNTSYSISVFNSPGVTSTLTDSSIQSSYGGGLNITHQLTPSTTLSPSFNYFHSQDAGRQPPGATAQSTDVFSAQMRLSRTITSRITVTMDYQYILRSSNLPGGNYYVNQVNVYTGYTF